MPSLSLFLTAVVRGQSALDGFDPNANGTVNVVVVQPDGKILLGGSFTTLAPNGGATVTRNRIARLNPDGSLDIAFNPSANDSVHAIAVQSDGKILVGGYFSGPDSIGGQSRNSIARLNATTGSADSFDPNANFVVETIVVQVDGRILVGGAFGEKFGAITIGGQTRNGIARLDPVTGLADSWNPNAEGEVLAIVLRDDNKILVAGIFSSIGGQVRGHIARLDAATGLADSFNPNANDYVTSIAAQPDGKILVAGQFNGPNSIGGQSRNRIARLDPTTGLADSFDPNANGGVNAIIVQPDGKVVVCGGFNGANSIGGQTRNHVARLDPVTGLADSYDPNAAGSIFLSIALQADGKVLTGGSFTTLAPNGGPPVTRNCIARLETDGRVDQTANFLIQTGASFDAVFGHAVQPDGKILIAGRFSGAAGVTRNHIARFNTDATLDVVFNPNANDYVYPVALQADGKILVGGEFTGIGGQPRNLMARLDAVTGLADSFNPNPSGGVGFPLVSKILIQADGKILVIGNFTTIGGQSRNGFARLDPTTGLADSFNPVGGSGSSASTMAIQLDNKILVGGYFTSIGGQQRNGLARLYPITGLADSFNPNPSGGPSAIAVQADGKILVSGNFHNIGGQVRNFIARLDPISGLSDAFDPNPDDSVQCIAVRADGKILVSGDFTNIGGQPRNNIARLDPVTGLADSFDANAADTVYGLTLLADGKIVAGGFFTNIGGQPRNRVARLSDNASALRSLVVLQNSVTWARGGSSQELARATFEYSEDNVIYAPLGNGAPSGSNWILTGLDLPMGQSVYIRARGYYQSGSGNGSGSITESIRYGPAGPPGPTPTATPTATATPKTEPTPTPTPTPVCIINPVVTTNADSGPGSLRQAMLDACLDGTITFDMAQVVSPIVLTIGPLFATADVTITGPGANQLIILGGRDNQPFPFGVFNTNVESPGVVTVSGLTLSNGGSPQGGIYHNGSGTLNITNCIVSNNVSTTLGGGIYNDAAGTINISNSTLDNNSSPGTGGGILNAGTGTVTVTNSTLSNNASFFAGAGGGISNFTGTVNVTNSTISGNSASAIGAPGNGGGIYNGGTIRLINTTITNNSAGNGGGILNGGNGSVEIWNSIVALNTGTDLNGAFITLGHNLIGQNDGSTGFTPGTGNPNGDLVGTSVSPIDPRFGPLAGNGGPTLTHLLQKDSLAINAGDNAAITNPPFNGPPFFDQRGIGFSRIVKTSVDIGSVEVGPTPVASPTPTATPTPTPNAPPTTLANISTRLRVETGNNVLIGGFIITGTQPKKVIVRAIGPSLSSFFPGALADPVLELRDSSGGLIMSNDNWRIGGQEAEIILTGIPPSNDLESAIVATLPASNSAYTAIVRGVNNEMGIGVVEVYDLDPTVDSKLANISTRGLVQTGNNVLIGGLIVRGQNPLRVIVRAIGPSLPFPGALGDPTLELHDGNGALLASNDNWRSDHQAEIIATGIPPSNDLESAIVRNLTPGNYTAIVRGMGGATGVALVEIYGLN